MSLRVDEVRLETRGPSSLVYLLLHLSPLLLSRNLERSAGTIWLSSVCRVAVESEGLLFASRMPIVFVVA